MFRSPWDQLAPSAPRNHLLGCGDVHGLLRELERVITINDERLCGAALRWFLELERSMRFRLPTGDFWYDRSSGAIGRLGGPTAGFLPDGLPLGGSMSAGCSGVGTGIFLNGREIHDLDRRCLERRLGRLATGRYSLDARGRLGREGGPVQWHLSDRVA